MSCSWNFNTINRKEDKPMLRVTAFEAEILQQLTLRPATMGELNKAIGQKHNGPTQGALSWLYNRSALTKHKDTYILCKGTLWEIVDNAVAKKERSKRAPIVKTIERNMTRDESFFVSNHLKLGYPRSKLAKRFGMERCVFDRWILESNIHV
jgi:hypothetical protein